jgi:o-succinylbenzoate synthase
VIIDRIDLRLLRLPLVHFFETSFERVHDRSFVLVEVHGEGERGIGECVADETPYYAAETTETAWHVITRFLGPRVIGRRFGHPSEVFQALSAVRGHNMAKASVEMAAWDLYARQQSVPLSGLLGGVRSEIAAGVSVGIQDSLEQLVEKVGKELSAGYQRVKIKIKRGWDVEAVEAIRRRFGAMPLMVDANGAYTIEDADHLARLDEHGLLMIEQPLGYDDLFDHAELRRRMSTPVCLDESIGSARAGADAIRLGACTVVNVKPGRVGGFQESIRLHDLCAAAGVPVWHGGMLESGIGRAHNIHLASMPNFSLPGDIAASERYYDPDLIEPPVRVSPGGTIPVPHGPGIGVTVVPERVRRATLREVTVTN